MQDGGDVTIIATGLMVQEALEAAKLLAGEGIKARVLDMHTIKPLDTEAVLKAARETGAIVTAEEHNIIGGLGGAVAEFVSGSIPVPVLRIGTEDTFGRSGNGEKLLIKYGLTKENIALKAKQAIGLRRS
jgi:transketolase